MVLSKAAFWGGGKEKGQSSLRRVGYFSVFAICYISAIRRGNVHLTRVPANFLSVFFWVGLLFVSFFKRNIPVLSVSVKLNLCLRGLPRPVTLFAWSDGPEAAVGGGQWVIESVLLWGLRNLVMRGCTGGLWNKGRACWAFLVLQRPKSAPVSQ